MQPSTAFWPQRRGHLETLSEAECIELLRSCSVGRLGFGTPDGQQRIFPVNHACSGDTLWFTTGATSEIARHAVDRPVAYQVDQLDEFLQAGWSVLANGVLRWYSEPVSTVHVEQIPDTWAEHSEDLLLRLRWQTLTGRRLQAH